MLILKNMTAEEFKRLSKEEQDLELKRCESFEYFYNNYCRKEGMPEYSEKEWKAYVEKIIKKDLVEEDLMRVIIIILLLLKRFLNYEKRNFN